MSTPPAPARALVPQELVRHPDYLRLLLLAAVLGVPISLAGFGFLVLLHQVEAWIWHDLPHGLGMGGPPWWWPIPLLLLAGLLVGLVIRGLPGHGGHSPIEGLSTSPADPRTLPGALLAALASLCLGAVLGPEAPLIALGGGLAIATAHLLGRKPGAGGGQAAMVIGVAGATAAIATVFGNPLIAAVIILEAAQLSGMAMSVVLLPCLISTGVGAVVFTGLGHWTGLSIGSLTLPLPSAELALDVFDLLWAVPLAVVAAFGVRQLRALGWWAVPRIAARPMAGILLACLGIGLCAAAYALLTGRSPDEVVLSGQQTLARLSADPAAWSAGALVALLLFKGVGYGLSLAALRGGPAFPAICLGGALGVLAGPLPGLGTLPALAAGMAAATVAALPLPLSSSVLVVVLLGFASYTLVPVVLIATVVAFVAEQVFEHGFNRATTADLEQAAQ